MPQILVGDITKQSGADLLGWNAAADVPQPLTCRMYYNSTTNKFHVIDSTGADILTSSATNFADAETPSGTINGSNTAFTLAHAPSPAASLILSQDGLLMSPGGVGFTLSGTTLTCVNAPVTTLLAWYRY